MNIRRFRVASLLLLVVLFAVPNGAAKKTKPKLAETIDLPQSYDIDFQLAAKQRVAISAQATEVPDDVAGRVGTDVFRSLVGTQMVSGHGLPYSWRFTLRDSPSLNAFSLPDGEVVAFTGISRYLGTNRGLWAAVLAHEIAHVTGRHGVQKALFHEYIQEQIQYWHLRARLGDKGAVWAELGVRIAGNLAEKKLSRDLESDADRKGMLLMARAGYHPDYVFAMHHILRLNTGDRSKVGTFFLSDHPRWETRDQRTDRTYTEALAEYNHLWPSPADSPGGTAPAVAFLGSTHGIENKAAGTGDLALPLTCRNVAEPISLVIHFTKSVGASVSNAASDYRDSSGNFTIQEHATCPDKDNAKLTIVHIPAQLIAQHGRKLKAQVDFLGPGDEVLERSKLFDVHFPKADKKSNQTIAKVWVEPEPGAIREDTYPGQHETAKAAGRTPVLDEAPRVISSAFPASPNRDSGTAAATVAAAANRTAAVETEPVKTIHTVSAINEGPLGVFPFAVDNSGQLSHWANSTAPVGSGTWWQLAPADQFLKIGLSRGSIFFPTQRMDADGQPVAVVITNESSARLTLPNIAVTGTDASDFSEVNDCGHSLVPGDKCTVSVLFKPTGNGTRTATIDIGASQRIPLSGIAK